MRTADTVESGQDSDGAHRHQRETEFHQSIQPASQKVTQMCHHHQVFQTSCLCVELALAFLQGGQCGRWSDLKELNCRGLC